MYRIFTSLSINTLMDILLKQSIQLISRLHAFIRVQQSNYPPET